MKAFVLEKIEFICIYYYVHTYIHTYIHTKKHRTVFVNFHHPEMASVIIKFIIIKQKKFKIRYSFWESVNSSLGLGIKKQIRMLKALCHY
jgi:hypothetical protein